MNTLNVQGNDNDGTTIKNSKNHNMSISILLSLVKIFQALWIFKNIIIGGTEKVQ